MEKTNKDYIAVPTSEPPVYEEEEQIEVQQPKKSRRLKLFLIGGAIALIGLGHLCNHKYNEFKEGSRNVNLFEYPPEVDNVETAHDLNEFMGHLDRSFGPRPCGMHFNGPPPPPHGPHGHPPPPPPGSPPPPPHGPHGHPPPPPPGSPPPPPPHGPHGHPPPPPHGPHGHPPPPPHGPHGHPPPPPPGPPGPPPHHPKEPNHSADSEEFDGEQKLDSHRKFHGFSNHEDSQNEKFDGERKLDSHHKHHGFPKHHNNEEEFQNFDMPPLHHRPPPGIGLLFDGKEKHHPFHNEDVCKAENLTATSGIFSFSPEKFQKTAVFLDGFFSHGSKVSLSKSTDESIQDVRVNVTLFHGSKDLVNQVVISAFDHKGTYQVEVKRDHHGHGRHHRGPPPPPPPHLHNQTIEDCLLYTINVEFPANTDYFDAVDLHIKGAHSIEGNIEDIEFGSVKAGLGHGVINFETLKAKTLKLGVLDGVVVGNYHVADSISAGSIHGGIKLNVFPTGENINVTASAISSPSIVNIPSESYSGKFFVSSFSGDSTIQGPIPEDIHVTKIRPFFKKGYYKEDNDESHIFVSSKHKFASVKFN